MADYVFNEAETKLVLSMIKNIDGPLKVLWEPVAQETGYKNATVASCQWSKLKMKLRAAGVNMPSAAAGTPSTDRKRKADTNAEEDGTPTKTKKGRGRSKAVKDQTPQDEASQDDEHEKVVKDEPAEDEAT